MSVRRARTLLRVSGASRVGSGLLPALRAATLAAALLSLATALVPPARAGEPRSNASSLFREEMLAAPAKLKWHGPRLSEDTLYAVALTGTSWEQAWGREPMFSLAWGDSRRLSGLTRQNGQDYIEIVHEVQRLYEQKQYRQSVQAALKHFTLDQIGCDVFLKEPVGLSFMALGQPEQAFPIFAAPFEPPHTQVNVAGLNRRFREAALDAAQHAGLTREAVAFALSLVLDPGTDEAATNTRAIEVLDANGVDLDRVLLGILAAPERLRGLPPYSYAAADLLVQRSSPRQLPVLLHLANSDDAYLRSRAVLGLGIAAYRARTDDAAGWAAAITTLPLREFGLSAAQLKMVNREIREAAGSDKYRVRAAAALAVALTCPPDAEVVLQKLARDRDYILITPPTAPANARTRRIEFPVRVAAAAGLARYGVKVEASGGDLEGRALELARRGCQDVTGDRRNLRKDVASAISVSPLDRYFAPPQDFTHR